MGSPRTTVCRPRGHQKKELEEKQRSGHPETKYLHQSIREIKACGTFREAVRMIASLGVFLGRKGDGEPSVKTIWLGLGRLHDISETWKLSDQISSPIEPP
jgi:hypothetical protein